MTYKSFGRRWAVFCIAVCWLLSVAADVAVGDVRTWDGVHSISTVEVEMVYFLPSDRVPLPDWKERLNYYRTRIEQFHRREYGEQSSLRVIVRDDPFVSNRTTKQLRAGDANAIFFKTLREVDSSIEFAKEKKEAFPILLVMSDINWRPLEDFYRLATNENGKLQFEGNYNNGRHFPGATSGGARATYLSKRGVGWGLVSADGWRVPYTGSDCVVYHEGVGHTVGLPHPEPGNGSVMSLGQYNGWINQSWLDDGQKMVMKWERKLNTKNRESLFTKFTAVAEPLEPKPGEQCKLVFTWPETMQIQSLRVQTQTDLWGPWMEHSSPWISQSDQVPSDWLIGTFDRPTPVSYRVNVVSVDGQETELWGYFQVRASRNEAPMPSPDAIASLRTIEVPQAGSRLPRLELKTETNLLADLNVSASRVVGEWRIEDGKLIAPKGFGARLELPTAVRDPLQPYKIDAIVEPLDDPNGFILGHHFGGNSFLTLFNFDRNQAGFASAIENIDGENVGVNESTLNRKLMTQNRLSQIVCTVSDGRVTATCDGEIVFDWSGDFKRLTLGDYWKVRNSSSLFIGAYNCGYRIHQLMLYTP